MLEKNTTTIYGQELLTVKAVGALLHKSQSFVHKGWPKWVVYGVHPIRIGGTKQGRLLFRRLELERMLDKWQMP